MKQLAILTAAVPATTASPAAPTATGSRCGAVRDTVYADEGDRFAGDGCETVRR